MVKALKKNIDVKKIGVQVHNVNSSEKGEIQIQLTGREKSNEDAFEKEVITQIGGTATSKLIEKTETIVIRDLAADIEQAELEGAITEAVGEQVNMEAKIMVTSNNRGLKHAFVTMPARATRKLMQRARIHIGWSRCRIEEKIAPARCFKCLELGHVAAKCRNNSEKGKRCFKCGESDHKVKDCQNPAKCL